MEGKFSPQNLIIIKSIQPKKTLAFPLDNYLKN